ncbi:MAG: SAM-dependent methyltransferase [Janthinobacterium lividum]
MTGILYLIPNTLGSAAEGQTNVLQHVIPEEVQRITAGLTCFIAENAKSTRAFLKLVAASHPLAIPLQEIRISELNVNTAASFLPELLAPMLAGLDAGLISEAGVPAVADPGANLVRLAHAQGIDVRPLVGPSSILLAVMASGLSGQSFAFNGYLPVDPSLRGKRVRELELRSRVEKQTQLFIETPYRNQAMLETLASQCQSGTLVCVATDLTLSSESIATCTAAQWKQRLAAGRSPDFQRRPTVFLLLAD